MVLLLACRPLKCSSGFDYPQVHELGHTLGLRHCPDWRCVMASAHAVERLDLKEPQFCAACLRAAGLSSLET